MTTLTYQERFKTAKGVFDEITQKNGKSCITLAGLGHIANARKNFVRAREYFEEAIKLSADNKDEYNYRNFAVLGLGWVNANEHKDKEAIECYKEILGEEPLNILALLGMGNAYNWLGEYDNARKYFKRVLEIDKNNEYALAGLGTVYLNKGDTKQAEGLLTNALKVNNSTFSCPYEGLGVLYMKQGKLKEAEDNFKKAITINPDIEYRKYNGLAEIYIKQEKYKEAKELLDKAIKNYPDNLRAKELLRTIEGKG